MARIRFAVTEAGITREINTTIEAWCLWEAKYKSKQSQLADGIGMTDMAYLAYESLRTSFAPVPATFEAFIKSCEDIEVVDSATERPTQGVPTEGD